MIMKVIHVFISSYTSHLNQILYSLVDYTSNNKQKLSIIYDKEVKHNCVRIENNGITYLLDYSDDYLFIDNPSNYDFYFKRSLQEKSVGNTIKPLNFQVNIATNPLKLFALLPKDINFIKNNKVEIARMFDFFGLLNMGHYAMIYNDIIKFREVKTDGKIIFYTRLWDPDNNNNAEEKERRKIQNDFRIEACNSIKSNFKNSTVGIFDSKLAREICPKLIFPNKIISKRQYFKELSTSSICIADDGLKDTPGWKIGEYALFGKSIISTPLNVVIEGFNENENYLKLSSRKSFLEIPEKIEQLLVNDFHLKMSKNNISWSEKFINPINYIKRILEE